jgi:endoribonuclease Dicer
MSLPLDRYTKFRETYSRIDHDDGTCQVKVKMPISSMIHQEIFGERKSHIRLAKQHAAFKACKMLIDNGSLTDNLTPIDTNQKIEEFDEEYFSHWKKYKGDATRLAGTKNNRRFHKMKIPEVIRNCGPSTSKNNFLYRISIKPAFDAGADLGLNVFHDLINNENSFGILTTKRIPKLCRMYLFQSFGKITCEINALPSIVVIENENELQALRKFHINIFHDILKVFRDFLIIDKSSYLIVPVSEHNDNGINWALVEQFKEISPPTPLTIEQIKSMDFKREDYLYKVLNPVYRQTDQDYVITDVLEHKTPLSQFPDESKAPTYAAFFNSRDHQIHRNDQFLVQVKGISKNLNQFFPGSGESGENKKSARSRQEEYVPELCHNYKFPADYWLKATLLPSICHRMHYLLIAEELRMWLVREKIDHGHGQQVYKLDIDYNNGNERKEKAEQYDPQTLEDLVNFKQILQQQKIDERKVDDSHKKTFSMWNNNQKMPIDLDRNLRTVTEADIDYYLYFIGNRATSSSVCANQQFGVEKRAHSRQALKDSASRTDIKLINLTNAGSSVQQKDLIKVLTTANAGDVFDMERFETLGDAFLKFISSLFLYKSHEKLHQGHLTALKGKLVSNRNLFYIGNDFGLSQQLKTFQFCFGDSLRGLAPSSCIPEGIRDCLNNKKSLLTRLVDLSLTIDEMETGMIDQEHMKQFLLENSSSSCSNTSSVFCLENNESEMIDKGMLPYINESYIDDKTIADAVEALIGCVISSNGPSSALRLCEKLKIIPGKNLGSLLTEKIPPRIPCESANEDFIVNLGLLEQILGYKFQNTLYLRQALTHTSYPVKDAGTYENLEFLGDAVLDFLVSNSIFLSFKLSIDTNSILDYKLH